jgi:hypothetical protein
MNVCAAFVANPQAPELVQPTDRPFHDPPEDAQATAVLGVPLGEAGLDPSLIQLLPVRIRVVRPIAEDFYGTFHRVTDLSGDGRDGIDQRDQLGHVVAVAPRKPNGQWNAFRIRDEVMFRPAFPAIHGAGTGTFAPPTARTWLESTTAADRSSCSSARSRFSKTLCTFSHTPAFCQASRYRQQLIPEPQPISGGRSSHGMPLFKTNRMPVSTWRRSRGLRPGYLNRRGLGGGRSGSIRFHNPSSSNGLAMIGSPYPSMTSANQTLLHDSFC